MAPTLVVRQWGGGFQTPELLNKLGVEMAQISFGTDLAHAEANLLAMGEALGASQKAEALLANMQTRLARIDKAVAQRRIKRRALYLTPGGVSAGQGTFVDDLMTRAGVINIAAENGAKGWPDVKLEELALNPPDMIITGFFDLGAEQPSHWSIARHSFLRQLFKDVPTLHLPGRLIACSAWFGVEAVEQIYEASQSPFIAEAHHDQ
jgi:iron complex transport system substrate-binding protein